MNKKEVEIACQQVLMEETAVFSLQTMDLSAALAQGVTTEFLLERYLRYIRRCTAGLIQPCRSAEQVNFTLLGSRWSLLQFRLNASPRTQGKSQLQLHICGGILVQSDSCDRGELLFEVRQTADGATVVLQLSDYCPLLLGGPRPKPWRKWLYRLTQAALHKVVTVRFLLHLYRELAGTKACCRVVRCEVVQGEDI